MRPQVNSKSKCAPNSSLVFLELVDSRSDITISCSLYKHRKRKNHCIKSDKELVNLKLHEIVGYRKIDGMAYLLNIIKFLVN